jgi:hypothetical protein
VKIQPPSFGTHPMYISLVLEQTHLQNSDYAASSAEMGGQQSKVYQVCSCAYSSVTRDL